MGYFLFEDGEMDGILLKDIDELLGWNNVSHHLVQASVLYITYCAWNQKGLRIYYRSPSQITKHNLCSISIDHTLHNSIKHYKHCLRYIKGPLQHCSRF
jgi:hypothetical protein